MVFALAHAAIYLVLLGIVLQRRSRRNPAEVWLLVLSISKGKPMATTQDGVSRGCLSYSLKRKCSPSYFWK